MNKVFPFIVGRGRSGTTLVRALLDSHPTLAIPPESHFIVPLYQKRHRYERPEGFDNESFVADLPRDVGFSTWGISRESVIEQLGSSPPADYAEAVRGVFMTFSKSRGKDLYGDKTPIQVMHLDLLGRLFPEARFIHIIRDGRDSAASYLRVGLASTIEEAAIAWRRQVKRGLAAGARLGERYMEVRYEHLVAEPEVVTRSFCDFLGLEFDPNMLRYAERFDDLFVHPEKEHVHQNLRRAPVQGLRDWRRELSREQVLVFEVLAGDLLQQLGYESGGYPALSDRISARRAQLAFESRRVARRIKSYARARS